MFTRIPDNTPAQVLALINSLRSFDARPSAARGQPGSRIRLHQDRVLHSVEVLEGDLTGARHDRNCSSFALVFVCAQSVGHEMPGDVRDIKAAFHTNGIVTARSSRNASTSAGVWPARSRLCRKCKMRPLTMGVIATANSNCHQRPCH